MFEIESDNEVQYLFCIKERDQCNQLISLLILYTLIRSLCLVTITEQRIRNQSGSKAFTNWPIRVFRKMPGTS